MYNDINMYKNYTTTIYSPTNVYRRFKTSVEVRNGCIENAITYILHL